LGIAQLLTQLSIALAAAVPFLVLARYAISESGSASTIDAASVLVRAAPSQQGTRSKAAAIAVATSRAATLAATQASSTPQRAAGRIKTTSGLSPSSMASAESAEALFVLTFCLSRRTRCYITWQDREATAIDPVARQARVTGHCFASAVKPTHGRGKLDDSELLAA
jgi:hypothetical protein